MIDYYLERLQSRGQALFYGVTLGVGTLLLVFSGWLWWHYQHLNPENVFWSAVNNNLVISGVTKNTVSKNAAESLQEYEQISLGANNLVKSVTTNTQEGDNKTTVVTETIGTPNANFARYTKIETSQKTPDGKTIDFSPVLQQWSKAELGGMTSGNFATAIYDAIPFARFNFHQRQQIVKDIKDQQVYEIDFNKVTKERKDGRLYYTYDVGIVGDKYISLLKQVDAMMGLNQLKELDPAQYQGGAPIQAKITIDAVSQQLSSLTYVENNRTTSYSAWGAQTRFDVPDKTISQQELEAKLNGILGGQ